MTPLLPGKAFGFLVFGILAAAVASDEDAAPPAADLFSERVAPLLAKNCIKCHGGRTRIKAGLRMTSRAELLDGGDSGAAIDLEDPGASLLLAMISYSDADHEMPPDGKLSDEERATLTEWVQLGAPWPAATTALTQDSSEDGADDEVATPDDGMRGWSYRPLVRPTPAATSAWVTNEVDQFILARLEDAGIEPVGRASDAALIRRVTYDLTGLPPTPQAVAAFVDDERPDAYERLIEDLLASPHYGEKWGRHWLDLVRYAETNGYERDTDKPNMWRYRDYVVDAFNQDKPYDQFIREQLAGDELDGGGAEQLIATGYYRLMIWDDEPPEGPLKARYDMLDDVVRTTSEVFLGMTIGCARCHDHKKDPIPQEDYYSFMAFFHGITDMSVDGFQTDIMTPPERAAFETTEQRERSLEQAAHGIELLFEAERELSAPAAEQVDGETPTRAQLAAHGSEFLPKQLVARHAELVGQLETLRAGKLPRRMAAAVQEHAEVADLFVQIRGNPNNPGERVEPRIPHALADLAPVAAPAERPNGSSGRRHALADWIAHPDNPTTWRVVANRIWQHHFGRGIVPSSSDFGELGRRPTHPELLDWLASEFMAQGFSFKAMHRLIMTSSTYRLAATAHADGLARDPDNNLFWRFDGRRLTAEELRDSLLAVGGTLNPTVGGAPFYEPMPEEVLATSSRPDETWGTSPLEETQRRSLYIKVKRSLLAPLLTSFDMAPTDTSCAVRFTTTQPTQALSLLNGAFMQARAHDFAERIAGDSDERATQVRRALELALQRQPTEAEVADHIAFLTDYEADFELPADKALQEFCLMVLNLNEFAYLD